MARLNNCVNVEYCGLLATCILMVKVMLQCYKIMCVMLVGYTVSNFYVVCTICLYIVAVFLLFEQSEN